MNEESRLFISFFFYVAGFIAGYTCPLFRKSLLRTIFYPDDKKND